MKVRHFLATIDTVIGDESVTVFRDSRIARDFRDRPAETGDFRIGCVGEKVV